MKKQLLIAALTLTSATVFASKARISSLQGAATLSDFSDILTKPDQAIGYGETFVLEYGTAQAGGAATGATLSTAGAPQAEGGFVRKMDNAALGLYFGNTNFSSNRFRSAYNGSAAAPGFLLTENTVNLIYAMDMGDMAVGAGLAYSKSSRKPDVGSGTEKTQDLAGVYLTASGKGTWDAQLSFGLMGSAKSGTGATEQSMKGKGSMGLEGGMWMDTMYAYGSYQTAGAKFEVNGADASDDTQTLIKVGVENLHKKDGGSFFYGAGLSNLVVKNTAGTVDTKEDSMFIPVNAGAEVDANSWLTLRGSITQNIFLMDSYKKAVGTATTDKRESSANTTVAAGAGLKLGKATLDGVLTAGTTGVLNTTSLMTNMSFTYMF